MKMKKRAMSRFWDEKHLLLQKLEKLEARMDKRHKRDNDRWFRSIKKRGRKYPIELENPNPLPCTSKSKQHSWKIWSTRGYDIYGETCTVCKARRERWMTKEEKAAEKEKRRRFDLRSKELHRINWEVQNWVTKHGGGFDSVTRILTMCNREFKDPFAAYLTSLAKKYPKRVFEVRVDDDHFCGSSLFFITHDCDKKGVDGGREFMGTTVWYIGQCTYDPPVSFFLYPSHIESKYEGNKRDGLISVLRKLQVREKQLGKGRFS